MTEIISKFTDIMNTKIKNLDSTYIKRLNRDKDGNIINKLCFKDVLFASVHNLNDSIDIVKGTLKKDCKISVSKNAIVKQRNKPTTHQHIRDLNDHLIKEIYNKNNNFINPNNLKIDQNKTSFRRNNNKIDDTLYVNYSGKRFVGIDGSQDAVSDELIDNRYIKPSKNGLYGICMISSMFDIVNKIPINFQLSLSTEEDIDKKKFNETKGFLDQIDKLNGNDVATFDRLYYSYALENKLRQKKIDYIFRMKNNSKLFRNIKEEQSKLIIHNGKLVQIFKYKIKDEIVCILTSITDRITIPEIKALYWLRWNIETDFKKLKYDILVNKSFSLTYNSLMTRLESLKFMSILACFIDHTGHKKTQINKKINSKNCIKLLYNCLLKSLIYNIRQKTKINNILTIIFTTVTTIVKNRSYARIRISPSTKWNVYGNRYGNG